MYRFRLPSFAVAGALLAASVGAAAQDTATATATATVVSAISITKDVDLDFGNLAAGTTAGTVVMSPASARSATGGVTLSSVDAGQAASFSVTGDSGATYAITLPGAAVTITHTNTVDTMTVDTFTSNPSGTGTLTGGSETLTVGATLNVDANEVSGVYSGTFDVTVAYN